MAEKTAREQEVYLWSMFRLFTPAAVPVAVTIPVGDSDVYRGGVGAVAQGFAVAMTDRETNLQNSGRLPDDESYVLRELGFAIFGGLTPSGIRRLCEGINAELETLTYKQEYGPLAFYPGGIGTSGFSGVAGEFAGSNGQPTLTARRKLKQVVVLRGGTTFTGHFHVRTAIVVPAIEQVASAPVDLVWMYYGRRVQTERLRAA